MRFIGYWAKQLLVAEFHELQSCRHYYRDCDFYEPGDWVVKASIGMGANVRSYFICPTDKTSEEGYRPFHDQDEANAFIEGLLQSNLDRIDLRKLGACCAFMEDTYAKVKILDGIDDSEETP